MRFRQRAIFHSQRAQTILELAFFVSFIASFMVLAYAMFSVFNVSQKQTMLLRTQAFIELGNHSDFSQSRHGQDDPKGGKGRVDFSLGQKSKTARVDLDKVEPFKKATEGELQLDITRALKDDLYWNRYQLPKAKTQIVWLENRNSQPLFQLDLHQTLSIVHNRSIRLSESAVQSSRKETGAYSGSLHFEAFVQLLSASKKITGTQGLIDDLEVIREATRQLVRNDPSLSKEAEELEKSLNAIEGLTGGLQASLISAAIQMAMVEGMQALKGLSSAGRGAQGGAQGAAQGAGASYPGLFDRMTGGLFSKPEVAAGLAAKGDLGSTLVNTAVSPVRDVVQGFNGFTGALGQLADGGAFWQGATQAMSGLSQIGQSASLAASFAGTNLEGLDLAVSALAAPGAITSGLDNLETSFHDIHTNNGHNWTAVVKSFSEVVTPITQLLSLTSSDLAVPLSYVNTGIGLVGAVSSGVDMAKDLGKGPFDLPQTLQDVGMFTASMGALYSGVAGLTGKDPTLGAYISLGGTAMAGLGAAVEWSKDLKKDDFKLGNPVKGFGDALKQNFTGAADSLKNFSQEMREGAKTIGTNMNQLFGPKVKIADPNGDAAGLMTATSQIDDKTLAALANMGRGVKKGNLSGGNIDLAARNLKDSEEAVLLNMKYHGASDQEVRAMKEQFQTVQETVAHLQAHKANPEGVALDSEKVRQGRLSAEELNRSIASHILNPENDYAKKQIKAIRAGSGQKNLEMAVVAAGQTFEDQKKLERSLLDQKGLSGVWFSLKGVTGGERTLKAFNDQQRQTLELASLAQINTAINTKKQEVARVKSIVQTSEGLHGVLSANNADRLRQQARTLSRELDQALDSNLYNGAMRARIEAQRDKLHSIANGSREILSEKEYLMFASEEIDRAARDIESRRGELLQHLQVCTSNAC